MQRAELLELRDRLTQTVLDAVTGYALVDDAIFRDHEGHSLKELKAEAYESAIAFARLSRIVSEVAPESAAVGDDLLALQRVLQALMESYVLIAAAGDWEDVRTEPLISRGYLDSLMQGRVAELLERAADGEAVAPSPQVGNPL